MIGIIYSFNDTMILFWIRKRMILHNVWELLIEENGRKNGGYIGGNVYGVNNQS